MNDERRFGHDVSPYERPGRPYVCGRGARWDQPCWMGPSMTGRCRGASECIPGPTDNGYECRRPERAGGPCAEGPLPDGRCAHTRPPCVPRPSLRRWRARLAMVTVALVVALVGAFADLSSPLPARRAAIDAGPLSRAHMGFIGDAGCTACHAPHAGSRPWLAAAFSPADLSGACLGCHTFDGPDRAAHNERFTGHDEVPEVACTECHREHRGAAFDLTRVADERCGNCHRQRFTDFAGHPEYPDDYPYQLPNTVRFDHTAHIDDYFVTPRWVDQPGRDPELAERARASCLTCHDVEKATRKVRPRGFEAVCSGCHRGQISERPLVLLTPEEPTPLLGLLTGLDPDALEDSDGEEALSRLLAGMARQGVDAFAEPLARLDAEERAPALLTGLERNLVRAIARAWRAGDEPDADTRQRLVVSGWRAGADEEGNQSLRYQPRGHADPVLRAWIELARGQLALTPADSPEHQAARLALDDLLDDEHGAGACGKCHAAGLRLAGLATSPWRYQGEVPRAHTRYQHAPHINILGPDRACRECHVRDARADYAAWFDRLDEADQALPAGYTSNFRPIRKTTCAQCHTSGGMRFDCRLCHTFHRRPAFRLRFTPLQADGAAPAGAVRAAAGTTAPPSPASSPPPG